MVPKSVIATLVNKHALKYALRPDVVMCIIIQESQGNTFAWRWEEAFYHSKLEGKPRNMLSGWVPPEGTLPSLNDERMQRSQSFGLMQCLGDTVRWCAKFQGPYLTSLCDPDVGIETGCKILSFYLKRSNGDYRGALTGYNGSSTYADTVLGRVSKGEHLDWFRSDNG